MHNNLTRAIQLEYKICVLDQLLLLFGNLLQMFFFKLYGCCDLHRPDLNNKYVYYALNTHPYM